MVEKRHDHLLVDLWSLPSSILFPPLQIERRKIDDSFRQRFERSVIVLDQLRFVLSGRSPNMVITFSDDGSLAKGEATSVVLLSLFADLMKPSIFDFCERIFSPIKEK